MAFGRKNVNVNITSGIKNNTRESYYYNDHILALNYIRTLNNYVKELHTTKNTTMKRKKEQRKGKKEKENNKNKNK